MAVSVTTDLVDISSCDTTTTNGTFYRLNGVNSGNPAAEADAKIQGTACIAFKEGASVTPTDTGGHFNSTNTFDVTNQHVFHWRLAVTPSNMTTKANRGTAFGLTNTSTTSTSAWSTTNYKLWFLDGSDTDKVGGWRCYVVDPNGTADASAGTLTLTTVKNCGFINRQLTSVNTSLNNAMVDAIRRGTGLTATTSLGTDTITFNSIYAVDSTTNNSWGILTQNTGIYFGAGKINIGASGQSANCVFKDTNAVLVWNNYPVANTLYGFNLIGGATASTTFQLGDKDGSNNTSNGCTIRSQGTAVWNITCGTNTDFKAYASVLSGIRIATLSSTSEIRDSSILNSGTIETLGATIVGCQLSAHTATQLKIASTSELAVVTNNTFTSSGTGHAIEITAVGNYTLTNLDFNNYATSNGSTGNEAVYVSATTGSVTLNITGGNTPSIRTAGATVTIVAGSVTVTVKAQTVSGTAISNANVFLSASSGGALPYKVTVTITNSGTTATVSHTGHGLVTGDLVLIEDASLTANNGVFSITKISDNSYSYTMASSPGSNPTGTILATYVLLKGLTNGSGEISMSRVFSSAQPVIGWARKSSSAPYYKTGVIASTVSNSVNTNLSALLIEDS